MSFPAPSPRRAPQNSRETRRITYTHTRHGLAWTCTCGESGVDGWDRYAMRAAREHVCRELDKVADVLEVRR